jgi:hypothetical protein
MTSVVAATMGAAGLYLGLASTLGWGGGILAGVALWAGAIGALYLSGVVHRPKSPRAFLVPGLGCLVASLATAVEMPRLLRATEATQLWVLMGSGVYLFFGLALLIASGFSALIAK